MVYLSLVLLDLWVGLTAKGVRLYNFVTLIWSELLFKGSRTVPSIPVVRKIE